MPFNSADLRARDELTGKPGADRIRDQCDARDGSGRREGEPGRQRDCRQEEPEAVPPQVLLTADPPLLFPLPGSRTPALMSPSRRGSHRFRFSPDGSLSFFLTECATLLRSRKPVQPILFGVPGAVKKKSPFSCFSLLFPAAAGTTWHLTKVSSIPEPLFLFADPPAAGLWAAGRSEGQRGVGRERRGSRERE